MNHVPNMQPSIKPLLLALMVVFTSLPVQAAGPNAGSILQQIQPTTPPATPTGETGLKIERQDGAKLPPSTSFEVKSIQLAGHTLFNTAVLQALVADAQGKKLTLGQLGELAERITNYYHSHGYPLARAIIPVQVIRDGAVTIEVIEARYGKINLENSSRVRDRLLQDTLAPLQSAQVIAQSPMDHALLLLSDIPGVQVNATLKPGESVGTSDLIVNTTPGPMVAGRVVLDGYGNRYTGRERLSGVVTVNNPLHLGDTLNLSALSSGNGLNYVRMGYESLLNGQGARLGGAWSTLRYELGDSLSSLDANGSAWTASLWGKQSFIRSRDVNLYGQIQYDHMQMRDHINIIDVKTDRHLNNWTLSLIGDKRDAFFGGGISLWNLAWSTGLVGFDDASAQLLDAATAKTQGGFSKWNVSLSRSQSLSANDALYFAFSGQLARTNLDSSQKMVVGGPYTVRAYDTGAMSGDNGYFASAEYRHDLGATWAGQWQAVAFVDNAHVTVNKSTWTSGTNSATLSGAGLGLNWNGWQQWSAKAYVAKPIGSIPELVGSTNSTRAWLEFSRQF